MTYSVAKSMVALSLMLAITSPGAVSASQDSGGDPIVVKGTRLDPREARQRAVDFVKRTGVADGQKQAARWMDPICPKVLGLRDDQAEAVRKTLVAVAASANIRVANPSCDPNILVAFTADAPALMEIIHARKASQFNEVPVTRRDLLRDGPGPARWWYSTHHRDREGVSENGISAPWAQIEGGGGLPIGDGVTATQQYNGGSHVRTATVRSLSSAAVVIDVSKIGDKSLDALGAFAAMVTLAEIAPDNPPPESMLGLFTAHAPLDTLTDWDRAFLKSLYRMPPDHRRPDRTVGETTR